MEEKCCRNCLFYIKKGCYLFGTRLEIEDDDGYCEEYVDEEYYGEEDIL